LWPAHKGDFKRGIQCFSHALKAGKGQDPTVVAAVYAQLVGKNMVFVFSTRFLLDAAVDHKEQKASRCITDCVFAHRCCA